MADRRAAVRRPHGLRLCRSVRQARARRRAHHLDRRHLDGTGGVAVARRDQRGRLELLRRLPAQAAARARSSAAPARSQHQRHSGTPVYRVHGGLQHFLQPGGLRPGNRHHAHAPGGHARLRFVHESDRRGGAVARTHRLLQLRRGVPSQARRRDVRIHQDEISAHLSLHQHQRPRLHGRESPAAGAIGHRRGDVLARWCVAGHLRAVSPARQLREGDRQSARARRRARQARTAHAVHQLALHPVQVERLRRGDGQGPCHGHRAWRRSAVLGDYGSPRGFLLEALRTGHARPRADPLRDLGPQRPGQRDPRGDPARRDLRSHGAAGSADHDPGGHAGGAHRARDEPVGPSVPRAIGPGRGTPSGPAGRAAH